MKKNIKKIIAVITMTVSIFTLIGCGQTNTKLKEEIKQEIKQDEVKSEENKKVEESSDITKESLLEFQKAYNEYNEKMNDSLRFVLKEDNPNKITVEQGSEIEKQAEKVKETVLKTTPKAIENEVKNYLDLYEQLFNNSSKTLKFGDEENIIINKKNNIGLAITEKIAELKTQLYNK